MTITDAELVARLAEVLDASPAEVEQLLADGEGVEV